MNEKPIGSILKFPYLRLRFSMSWYQKLWRMCLQWQLKVWSKESRKFLGGFRKIFYVKNKKVCLIWSRQPNTISKCYNSRNNKLKDYHQQSSISSKASFHNQPHLRLNPATKTDNLLLFLSASSHLKEKLVRTLEKVRFLTRVYRLSAKKCKISVFRGAEQGPLNRRKKFLVSFPQLLTSIDWNKQRMWTVLRTKFP